MHIVELLSNKKKAEGLKTKINELRFNLENLEHNIVLS